MEIYPKVLNSYENLVETGLFLLLKKEDPHQSYKHFSLAVDAATSSEKKSNLIQYRNAAASVLIRAQLETGDDFARHGHYGSALETYASISSAHDAPPAVQFQIEHNLGTCLAQLGRKDEALVCYLNAYKRNPRSMKTLKNIAILLADIGKYTDAIIAFDEYLLAHPKSYSAMCGKSGCFKDLKLYTQSIAVAEEAQSLDPLQKRDRCAHDLKAICEQEISKANYNNSRMVGKDRKKVDSIVLDYKENLDMKAYFESIKRELSKDNSKDYCLPQHTNGGRFLFRSKLINHNSLPLMANEVAKISPFCVQIPGNDLSINGTPYRINSYQSYSSERELTSTSSPMTQHATSNSESVTEASVLTKPDADARNSAIGLLLRQSPAERGLARSSMNSISDNYWKLNSSTLEDSVGPCIVSPLSVSVAIHKADRCKGKNKQSHTICNINQVHPRLIISMYQKAGKAPGVTHNPTAIGAGRSNHSKNSITGLDRSEMTCPIALNCSFNELTHSIASSPKALILNSLGSRQSYTKAPNFSHEFNRHLSPQTSQTTIDGLSNDFVDDRRVNKKLLLLSDGQTNDGHRSCQLNLPLQNQSLQAESTGNLKRMHTCHTTKFDKTPTAGIPTGAKRSVATSLSSATMSNFSSSSGKPQRRCLADNDHSSKTLDNYFDVSSTFDKKQADQLRSGALSQYRKTTAK